ncbi:inner-membrane translocator [Cupriavidus basilensis OR16]|uniref:Inner-membrane translocator n=1 Tax=Cupriavidus basilensis OR16 TaxID=1127483 RepID=H1RZY6_9BURK|nr:branched-chain amino acid ABC transporter permease [Cupriavidus basilensis]EHP44202.1 inner-membrane translocator [Cupriavidus basilensis OR16]
MNIYVFQALNGLGLGMIYFLLSVGLSIIFGLLGFVNFAHGALFLVGAYAAFFTSQVTGSFALGLVASFVCVASLGLTAERWLLRRTYKMSHEAQILVTVGLTFVLTEAVVYLFGPESQRVAPPESLSSVLMIGPYPIPSYRVFIVIVCGVIGAALWWLFERTMFGARVRAGNERPQMLKLLGTRVSRVYAIAFGLGTGLAGLAGGLAVPLRGADPSMGLEAIVIAFVVVVIGGMGSFSGPLVGGLIIGVTQSMMSAIWPEGARLAIFLLMVVVLLLMPKGLFGRA